MRSQSSRGAVLVLFRIIVWHSFGPAESTRYCLQKTLTNSGPAQSECFTTLFASICSQSPPKRGWNCAYTIIGNWQPFAHHFVDQKVASETGSVIEPSFMVVKNHIAHISSSTHVWVSHVWYRMLHFDPFCCFLFVGKTGKTSLRLDRHVATKWLKLCWYDDFAPKQFRVDLTWLHPTIIKHVVERRNMPHPWYRPFL